jgi:dipeptidyl aminopeptidase/acylaminoacyl peptidase
MKKSIAAIAILSTGLLFSCKQTAVEKTIPEAAINTELTEQEKAGGVMTPEIMWKFTRLGSFALSPDGSQVVYSSTKIDLTTEKRETDIFKISLAGGEPVKITPEGGSAPQWYDNGSRLAFVKDGALWTMKPDGTDPNPVAGIEGFDSYSISPTSDRIYFTKRVKLDPTANEIHGFTKANVRIIDNLMYRHWNAWSDFSYSHIFVGSFNGSEITAVKDIMENQRFESPIAPNFDESEITWSPDGKMIAYTTKRLNGKDDAVSTNSDIWLYDLATGTEKNISDGNMGYDRCPVFSPDGTMIAYQSMKRDGYEADLDRLFIYSVTDGTRKQVAPGWDYDVENICWTGNEKIFFTSSYRGTAQLFSVGIADTEVKKVTEGKHNLGPLNIKSGVAVAGIASMAMAPEICTVNTETGEIKKVTDLNGYIYSNIKMGKSEEMFTKTKDNLDLQSWVIYPPDFDPAKKYPLLLFCKGGPQGPLDQGWSYRWNYQMMAAKGYIVVAPNRRGNSGFGQAWKEQISGDYGGKNIQDYLDATDAMARLPYVDAARMGAVGASYGGFSVFYLAGVHNKRFKAFISHCGMFNFESWYGSTEELWFPNFDFGGPYWDKKVESYKFSPHKMVDKWDTPILIITGQNDFRIPYTQSMEAFQAAQLRGIPSKLLIFENETHFVTRPQNAVVWQREFFNWLDTYLK